MKKILFILFGLFIVSSVLAQRDDGCPTCKYNNDNPYLVTDDTLSHSYTYELVFMDDFDTILTDTTDGNTWEFVKQVIPLLSPLVSCNDRTNAKVQDGFLQIIAKQEHKSVDYICANGNSYYETSGLFSYTTGSVRSSKKFSIGHKFEARIRVPNNPMTWPAFGIYDEDGEERNYNEIDVFELVDTLLSSNSHYKNHLDNSCSSYSYQCQNIIKQKEALNGFHDEFHVFSMIWYDKKIEWYIDDSLVAVTCKYAKKIDENTYQPIVSGDGFIKDSLYYQAKFFPMDSMKVIFNIDVSRKVIDTFDSILYDINDTMFVDYIKVYRLVPCNEDVTINNDGYCYSDLGTNNDTVITGDNVFIKCNEINLADGKHVEIKANSNVYFMPISCPKMVNFPPVIEYEKDFIITTGDGSEFLIDIEKCLETNNGD